jgi:hypothetical protein
VSTRSFLVSGLVAGLLAGVAAFVVALTVGEPSVDAAIALEESHQHAGDHAHDHAQDHAQDPAHDHAHEDGEDALVSRQTQSTWGLATGTLATGVALGGLVGLVSALAMGRLGRLGPVAATALATLLGFVAMALVPFLKYPANPPAVGEAATIGARTGAYFGFVGVSVATVFAAVVLARWVLARRGVWAGAVAGGAAYVVIVTVAAAAFPAFDEVGDFPGGLLWDFRIGSLLVLAGLWGTLGVALSGLVHRTWERHLHDVARRELAASL